MKNAEEMSAKELEEKILDIHLKMGQTVIELCYAIGNPAKIFTLRYVLMNMTDQMTVFATALVDVLKPSEEE